MVSQNFKLLLSHKKYSKVIEKVSNSSNLCPEAVSNSILREFRSTRYRTGYKKLTTPLSAWHKQIQEIFNYLQCFALAGSQREGHPEEMVKDCKDICCCFSFQTFVSALSILCIIYHLIMSSKKVFVVRNICADLYVLWKIVCSILAHVKEICPQLNWILWIAAS